MDNSDTQLIKASDMMPSINLNPSRCSLCFSKLRSDVNSFCSDDCYAVKIAFETLLEKRRWKEQVPS